MDRAAGEPVRHRGLPRAAADAAGGAVAALGRAAMLLEAHLPDRTEEPVPGAADWARAVRTAAEEGAAAVRERRVPEGDELRAAPADGGGPGPGLLREAGEQLLRALDEVSRALRT